MFRIDGTSMIVGWIDEKKGGREGRGKIDREDLEQGLSLILRTFLIKVLKP